MSYLFVTGCNAAYFNTLLATLQSFALRLPGQKLMVCDYGLTPQQCDFLRGQGQLLARPPGVSPREHPYRCKAAILRYLEHGGHKLGENDVLIWLDADLTLMDVSMKNFDHIRDVMMQQGIQVAACRNGSTVKQMCEYGDREKMTPFREAVAFSGIAPNLPYYSIGIYFCRSAAFLRRWEEVTNVVKNHTCFEQNMFTLVVHRDRVPFMHLDMDEWQAQGDSLEKIEIKKDIPNGPAAFIGPKNVKIMHTTSSGEGHIQIIDARILAFDLVLEGMFKLFIAPEQFSLQLQLLGSYIVTHKAKLLRFGLCSPNPNPIQGFQFVPLQKNKVVAGS